MRVKIAKPAGGVFYHFAIGYKFDIEHRADDIVGDELWQMGRDRQHFVVMRGIHNIDHRARRGAIIQRFFRPPPDRIPRAV